MEDLWDRLWYSLYSTLIVSSIRLRWHRLWIRKDEFHSSLENNMEVIWHLEEPTRLTRRLLGFSSSDEYSRDLHFRRTVRSNSRLFYSHSDLRIRSLIATWRALQIHIHDLRFGDFFREINALHRRYNEESRKLRARAAKKHQAALP